MNTRVRSIIWLCGVLEWVKYSFSVSADDAVEFEILNEPLSKTEGIRITGSIGPSMSKTRAKKKAKEAAEAFFSSRNFDEVELNLTRLPATHRHLLIHNLVTKAMKSTEEDDAELVSNLFERILENSLCSQDAFDEGFIPTLRSLDPQVCTQASARSISVMLKAARLDVVCEKLLTTLRDLLETTPKASPCPAPLPLGETPRPMINDLPRGDGVGAAMITSVPSNHPIGPLSSGVTVEHTNPLNNISTRQTVSPSGA